MASFYTALTALKTILTDGLQNFCSQKWGKLPTVTISYKKRAEITLDEFPLVLITRPQVDNQDGATGFYQTNHTILLYVGFCEHDREKAAAAVIEFEETIESLIRTDPTLNVSVMDTDIVNSANDQGNFHPVYFFVVELKARHRTL